MSYEHLMKAENTMKIEIDESELLDLAADHIGIGLGLLLRQRYLTSAQFDNVLDKLGEYIKLNEDKKKQAA